jgi:prophage DNA circulation protein
MTWADNLLDSSFRGVPMNIMGEDLEAERSLAQHGVPYVDGDDVEDLGRGARIFAMKAVAFGQNYLIELQNILAALDTRGVGELIHPIYGSVQVVSGNYKVSHDASRPDYAEISMRFVERSAREPFFTQQFQFVDVGTLDPDDEETWQEGFLDLVARVDSLVATVQSWIGGGWTGLIERAIGLPGIVLRLQQMRSQILGVVSGVASMAGNVGAIFDPLQDLARTPAELRAAIQSGTPSSAPDLLSRSGLPSTMPGAASLTPEVARLGSALLAGARQGDQPDEASLPDALPDDPLAASGYALVTLVITEWALSYASAVSVVFEADADDLALSPQDLERLVNLVRSLIQAAILLHRRFYEIETALPIIEGLRTTAALIQVRARQLILQRPPLVERTVETAASLRLLAYRWYGDNTRAGELLRLNPTMRAPHSIAPGTVVKAYAK